MDLRDYERAWSGSTIALFESCRRSYAYWAGLPAMKLKVADLSIEEDGVACVGPRRARAGSGSGRGADCCS